MLNYRIILAVWWTSADRFIGIESGLYLVIKGTIITNIYIHARNLFRKFSLSPILFFWRKPTFGCLTNSMNDCLDLWKESGIRGENTYIWGYDTQHFNMLATSHPHSYNTWQALLLAYSNTKQVQQLLSFWDHSIDIVIDDNDNIIMNYSSNFTVVIYNKIRKTISNSLLWSLVMTGNVSIVETTVWFCTLCFVIIHRSRQSATKRDVIYKPAANHDGVQIWRRNEGERWSRCSQRRCQERNWLSPSIITIAVIMVAMS